MGEGKASKGRRRKKVGSLSRVELCSTLFRRKKNDKGLSAYRGAWRMREKRVNNPKPCSYKSSLFHVRGVTTHGFSLSLPSPLSLSFALPSPAFAVGERSIHDPSLSLSLSKPLTRPVGQSSPGGPKRAAEASMIALHYTGTMSSDSKIIIRIIVPGATED